MLNNGAEEVSFLLENRNMGLFRCQLASVEPVLVVFSPDIPDPGQCLGPDSGLPAARESAGAVGRMAALWCCGQGQCPTWPRWWANVLVCGLKVLQL